MAKNETSGEPLTTLLPNPPQQQPPPPTFSRRLRNYFVTGVAVSAPLLITAYLVWATISWIDHKLTPLIPAKYNPNSYLPFDIPGLGLVMALVALTVIGALTANFFGRLLIDTTERILNRMPVVRSIYGTTKQVFETIAAQNSTSFKQVVLVEYPRKGLWAIAFVAAETKGEVARVSDEPMVSVFLPTTPNPTSGFLLFVPRKDLVTLDLSIEEGIKYVISAGLVGGEKPKGKPPLKPIRDEEGPP
jgi:uncharacterized membrane protein